MKTTKRIFKIGQAEVNAFLDKYENPIKITTQSIRDLKRVFEKTLEAAAKVKAISFKLEEKIKKEQNVDILNALKEEKEKNEKYVVKIETNVKKLQSQINKWESTLVRLKAKYETAQAMLSVNKELAKIDSSGIIATLERMEEKTLELEALGQSYADMVKE